MIWVFQAPATMNPRRTPQNENKLFFANTNLKASLRRERTFILFIDLLVTFFKDRRHIFSVGGLVSPSKRLTRTLMHLSITMCNAHSAGSFDPQMRTQIPISHSKTIPQPLLMTLLTMPSQNIAADRYFLHAFCHLLRTALQVSAYTK